MTKIRTLLVALMATIGLVMIIPGGSAAAAPTHITASASVAAPHINRVPCSSNEFLKVWWHVNGRHYVDCFANRGVMHFGIPRAWLDSFWTGNNRVQWRGDGRWQPNSPVGKWTKFGFSHHPGGVDFEAISID